MNIQLTKLRTTRVSLVLFALALLATLLSSSLLLASQASAATRTNAPDKKDSFLLLYSDKGKYSKAHIVSSDGNAKCNGKTVTAQKGVTVSLSKAKTKGGAYLGVKVNCTPGSYNIFFLKKGDKSSKTSDNATRSYAAVSLPDGYCTFVHKKGATRNEAVVNKRCAGDDNPNEDTVTKFTPTITYSTKPGQVIQGKKWTYTVELKNPSGESMSPEECAGDITLNYPVAGSKIRNNQGEFPIKYNSKTKTCIYKANVSSKSSKAATTKLFNMHFKGNAFMNETTAEGRLTVIKDPAADAKDQKKKDKEAKKNDKKGNTATTKAKITEAKIENIDNTTVSLRAVVTGVDDCNRINPSLTEKVKAKGKKKANKAKLRGTPEITKNKVGDTCVLTTVMVYNGDTDKSDVSYKLSFKSGTKQKSKSTNKVTVGK